MCTALHIAVNKGFTDVVRILTEHSADVNLQVRRLVEDFGLFNSSILKPFALCVIRDVLLDSNRIDGLACT